MENDAVAVYLAGLRQGLENQQIQASLKIFLCHALDPYISRYRNRSPRSIGVSSRAARRSYVLGGLSYRYQGMLMTMMR